MSRRIGNGRRKLAQKCLLFSFMGVWLQCLTGCPTSPAPEPQTATLPAVEQEEPPIEFQELVGTWSGQAWQVGPPHFWQDAESGRHTLRRADPEVTNVNLISEERLAEFPSVTVDLTIIEGISSMDWGVAQVRTVYMQPGGTEPDVDSAGVRFDREPDGTLLLERRSDQIRIESVEGDRMELDGDLRGTPILRLVLTRQPDASETDASSP